MSLQQPTVQTTAIDGLVVLTPKTIDDERGAVREFFRTSGFEDLGLTVPPRWAQINLTYSVRGAIRGLHGEAMTKLVGLAAGEAFGAYVDARRGSSTFGQVVTMPLTVGRQVLVPPGVCNGFQSTSDNGCQYLYCFDIEWAPDLPGVAMNPLDAALGIPWPLPPVLSPKDAAAPSSAEVFGS